jgi:hypothetical protein
MSVKVACQQPPLSARLDSLALPNSKGQTLAGSPIAVPKTAPAVQAKL